MTTFTAIPTTAVEREEIAAPPRAPGLLVQLLKSRRVMIGGGILFAIIALCLFTLPFTVPWYTAQNGELAREGPRFDRISGIFGYDRLGRSLLVRCLMGGTISLAVGIAAATISVVLGVTVGLVAGYRGGWVDAALMRSVDVLYGLPYVLLVILFKVAFEDPLVQGVTARVVCELLFFGVAMGAFFWCVTRFTGLRRVILGVLFLVFAVNCVLNLSIWREVAFHPELKEKEPAIWIKMDSQTASVVVLFSAIGMVSWLTMARVVRGQVLSLRGQPFIEACRAIGMKELRIFRKHILPNLVGPITVYATLTVPSAILQESFLSFLGVGINAPLPTWGNLASEALDQLYPKFYWWMLIFPCVLLAITLLSLNFMGDGLRDVFDPKKETAKI